MFFVFSTHAWWWARVKRRCVRCDSPLTPQGNNSLCPDCKIAHRLYMRDQRRKTARATQTCSVCGLPGHNARTCNPL